MPTGAPERNREVALALADVVRQQVNQQRGNSFDEFARLREGSYVPGHFRMLTRVLLELRNVIRIREESNIEDEIAVRRHAISVTEAGHIDADLALIAVTMKLVGNQIAQFVDIQLRCVDAAVEIGRAHV